MLENHLFKNDNRHGEYPVFRNERAIPSVSFHDMIDGSDTALNRSNPETHGEYLWKTATKTQAVTFSALQNMCK